MSEFLFIVPDDWTQIDLEAAAAVNSQLNTNNIQSWAASEQYHYILDALVAQGMLLPTDVIIGAKIFNGEVFAVLLAE